MADLEEGLVQEESGLNLEWHELVVLPLIAVYILLVSCWIAKLYYFHQCYVATSGETAYEMIKGHYDGYEVSPHKRGSSCANFCRLVCCPKRVLDSRMDYQLQAATDRAYFSLRELKTLRD